MQMRHRWWETRHLHGLICNCVQFKLNPGRHRLLAAAALLLVAALLLLLLAALLLRATAARRCVRCCGGRVEAG